MCHNMFINGGGREQHQPLTSAHIAKNTPPPLFEGVVGCTLCDINQT